MLFSYTYVSHPLERLHGWIEHLLLKVWCRKGGPYSVTLLCQELQDIHTRSKTRKPVIFAEIEKIDFLIQALKQPKRDKLALMFLDSTSVDDLCRKSAGRHPYNYDELKAWDFAIAETLKTFFDNLFKKHINSAPIKRSLGSFKEHIDSFTRTNHEGICPFCGLADMTDENYTTRDDYDHYFPRSKYPFNSVNFRNLSPMCSTCNRGYKKTKDPISQTPGTRQRAFAPFQPAVPFPTIKIDLNIAKLHALTQGDITMTIASSTHQEEVDTWQWLFGIQERYKGKLCKKKRGALSWLKILLESKTRRNKTPRKVLEEMRADAVEDWYSDNRFLKVPTLAACKVAGLF